MPERTLDNETMDKINPTSGIEGDDLPAAPPTNAIVVHDDSEYANLLDTGRFNHLYRVAGVFARSKLVPDHFRGSKDDCMVALQMAFRLAVDPMMFMQKCYIVHGRPGVEAQLKIGLANSRGPFTGPIQWRMSGEGKQKKCTAYATHKVTGELCEYPLDWETVEKEGWADKKGSKWLTMPDKMFRYRSASWLIDLYCPEVTLGLATVDELLDADQPIDITPEIAVLPEPQREGAPPPPDDSQKPAGEWQGPEMSNKNHWDDIKDLCEQFYLDWKDEIKRYKVRALKNLTAAQAEDLIAGLRELETQAETTTSTETSNIDGGADVVYWSPDATVVKMINDHGKYTARDVREKVNAYYANLKNADGTLGVDPQPIADEQVFLGPKAFIKWLTMIMEDAEV
jgi:hypothetical protein